MPEYPALGDSADSPNGNRWLMLEQNSKYAYIVGFLQGMFQGHCFSTWGLPRSKENDPAYFNATESYKHHWNRFVARVTYCQFCRRTGQTLCRSQKSKDRNPERHVDCDEPNFGTTRGDLGVDDRGVAAKSR